MLGIWLASLLGSLMTAWGMIRLASVLVLRRGAGNSQMIEDPETVMAYARSQCKIILDEAKRTAEEQFELRRMQVQESSLLTMRLHYDYEKQLEKKEAEYDALESQIDLKLQDAQKKSEHVQDLKKTLENINLQRQHLFQLYQLELEKKALVRSDKIKKDLSDDIVSQEKLGAARSLLEQGETLRSDASRFAKEALNTILNRYSPTFVWPKPSPFITLPSVLVAQKYFFDNSPLLQALLKTLETQVELQMPPEGLPLLKLTGGSGVDREIARLVLEEIIGRGAYSDEKVNFYLNKHRRQLEKRLLKMGQDAVSLLELKPMHQEILRLIGALNFRTSHRQNQYYHSIEVARLAGMVADEVGVDSQLAKRSGLLHDIGKALDYKIEGSHAVISGDYALRYGEDEVVVDTVLSHHDDKIVETPHAFILKAADAMSGARPGARVDMEDGYLKRIEGIQDVVGSFQDAGVAGSAIMHAGREVHVFVDNRKVSEHEMPKLAGHIARKLEANVQFPGQIRVTVVRRLEVSEVA